MYAGVRKGCDPNRPRVAEAPSACSRTSCLLALSLGCLSMSRDSVMWIHGPQELGMKEKRWERESKKGQPGNRTCLCAEPTQPPTDVPLPLVSRGWYVHDSYTEKEALENLGVVCAVETARIRRSLTQIGNFGSRRSNDIIPSGVCIASNLKWYVLFAR